MEEKHLRGSFTGSLGFILAAAGSAVGLGNIWRFPYLAAKDGGGVFLLCYLILVLTFGFALLTAEIAIGRKTGQSPLTAYRALHKKFGWLGTIACLVPLIILPYYCAIGGWVLKYLATYLTGHSSDAVAGDYFTSFITAQWSPIIWFAIFFAATIFIVCHGVNSGIERLSRILMPILVILIAAISVFSLTLSHTDASGVTRTGMEGLMVYLIPNFEGMTPQKLLIVITDAMGQLFYSISVAMGIMITYGSYVKKETNLVKSVNYIEIFDTAVAFLAGMMIIPAIYTFAGTEGMASGPKLMFVSLPQVFDAMGSIGVAIGLIFFIVVAFAALTSSVSIMEAVVASIMDKFHLRRRYAIIITSIIAGILGLIVCLGYNVFYFELTLPNGAVAQILDVMDYATTCCLMPIVALITCVLIGWVIGPKEIIDEVKLGGYAFAREKLFIVMVKVVAPVFLLILLLQSLGIIQF